MDVVLLGQDHAQYGDVHTAAAGDLSAAALSVGADPLSPSLEFKGERATPNEDALCVVDTGDRVVLSVADAHFGSESSHELIARLHSYLVEQIPPDLDSLRELVMSLGSGEPPMTPSESTLLVAVVDRSSGSGYALSFGDSTLATVSVEGEYRQRNCKDDRYVTAGLGSERDDGAAAVFRVAHGDLVLAFTDGIDECHYRRPATSVQPHHIVASVAEGQRQPSNVVGILARQALGGVDGNPGGQDNIAVIAAIA